MSRAALVAITVVGVGLFGTGVRGLASLDGRLAEAGDRPAAHHVKRELGAPGDCPRRERRGERRL